MRLPWRIHPQLCIKHDTKALVDFHNSLHVRFSHRLIDHNYQGHVVKVEQKEWFCWIHFSERQAHICTVSKTNETSAHAITNALLSKSSLSITNFLPHLSTLCNASSMSSNDVVLYDTTVASLLLKLKKNGAPTKTLSNSARLSAYEKCRSSP